MIYQNDRQCLAQAIPVKSRQAWGRILSWEAKNTGVPCYCGEIPFRNPCISAEMLLGPSNQANFEVVTRGETSIESYLWIVTCNRLQAKSETLWGILSGCNLCMCDLLKCLLHTWLLWFTGAFLQSDAAIAWEVAYRQWKTVKGEVMISVWSAPTSWNYASIHHSVVL